MTKPAHKEEPKAHSHKETPPHQPPQDSQVASPVQEVVKVCQSPEAQCLLKDVELFLQQIQHSVPAEAKELALTLQGRIRKLVA